MTGASIALSEDARDKIGISGFGIEDSGVLDCADGVASLLTLGLGLNAVSENELEAFVDLLPGSAEQVNVATELCEESLEGLSRAVGDKVDAALGAVNVEDHAVYSEHLAWAQSCGWEFPVGWAAEGFGNQGRLGVGDTCGLCVLDIPTGSADESTARVLHVLIDVLTGESFKTSVMDHLMDRMEGYGLHMPDDAPLVRVNEAEVGIDAAKWLETNDPESFESLSEEVEGDEESVSFWSRFYVDVLSSKQEKDSGSRAVMGCTRGEKGYSVEAALTGIGREIEGWEDSALKTYIGQCVDAMQGPTSGVLFDELEVVGDFYGLPGQHAVVLANERVEGLGEVLEDVNEYACNTDDDCGMPLRGCPSAICAFLARVTIAERLLIGLSAMPDLWDLSGEKTGR